jgi:hypothetical protein
MKKLYQTHRNRTEYKMNRIKRYLSRYTVYELAIAGFGLVIMLWFALSFIDIAAHNLGSNTYHPLNIITAFMNA